MVDIALSNSNPLSQHSFVGASGTSMAPLPEIVQFSLRVAPQDLVQAAKCFGASIPAAIGSMQTTGQSLAMCLGPDEFQLRFPRDLINPMVKNFAHLQNRVPHSFVDISHRNISIKLSGVLSTQFMAAGCPIDLRAQPVGTCARSIMDKAPVTILKLADDQFELEFSRSLSPFAWQFLENSAKQREAEYVQKVGL